MKKPEGDLEKEFNKAGIHFSDLVMDLEPNATYVSLDIEMALHGTGEVDLPDFTTTVVSKRGVSTIFGGWYKEKRGEQFVLGLTAYQRVPDEIQLKDYPEKLAQSFRDLCWYAGNEDTKGHEYLPDVATNLRSDVVVTDLGWYLPCRVVDNFINALGSINDTLLVGLAEDAMLYLNQVRKV